MSAGVRNRVPGRWHPEVDVNAIFIDSEPSRGSFVEDGRKQGDTYRTVSTEMGQLIRNQEMCWKCLCEFPCTMRSGERLSIWSEAIDRGEFKCAGVLTPLLVLSRVGNHCCPMCGVPISDVAIGRQVRLQRADERSLTE